MSTLFQLHVQNWKDCTRCELSKCRKNVVFARGSVPADIMFTGEAPGESENLFGQPFIGPAGHLLDYIISNSVYTPLTHCITNILGCIPYDETGRKVKQTNEWDDNWVKSCSNKLIELVEICNPKLLVCVGSISRDWTEPSLRDSIKFHKPIPRVHILHPAYLLRQNFSMREIAIQRCIVTIKDAIENIDKPVNVAPSSISDDPIPF